MKLWVIRSFYVVLLLLFSGGLVAYVYTHMGVSEATSTSSHLRPPNQVLDGLYVAKSADARGASKLSRIWSSTFLISNGHFRISHFCGLSKDLTGTLVLDPARPGDMDLHIEALDISEISDGDSIPECVIPAIYKLEGDTLIVCFQNCSNPQRPKTSLAADRDTYVLSLVRANPTFKEFPKHLLITVTDATGRVVPEAAILGEFERTIDKEKPEVKPTWNYPEIAKTDPNGIAKIPSDALIGCAAAARDAKRRLVGFTNLSPALLQDGKVTVKLQAECHVTGTIICDELQNVAQPIGRTIVYLIKSGQWLGFCRSHNSDFEFFVPPGDYTLFAYGSNALSKTVEISVPAGKPDFHVPPIPLVASPLSLLEGRPAPELEDVLAWKGPPQKLADLKGKVILLDFWGYWCGPCIAQMPELMALHDRYKDKGLVIIGVHVDYDGTVDTPSKLDEKLVNIKKNDWHDKEIPFPIALASGKELPPPAREANRGSTAARYGIELYPTTLLIDRRGILLGRFDCEDTKDIAKLEQLLRDPN